jgi:chitin disaccharide deacetylase
VKIIINADDFGYDSDSVAETISCFERGGLTSATIMANMPGTDDAIDFALKNPQFSFGVHLNWVEGKPLTNPTHLMTHTGVFRNSQEVRRIALLRRGGLEQIVEETRAQIRHIAARGLPISHVDSHGHLHKFNLFMQALEIVLPEFGIRRVRTAQNVYIRKAWLSPTFWLGSFWGTRIREKFKTTDYLAMPDGKDAPERLKKLVQIGSPGQTLEVGVHPGRRERSRELQTNAAILLACYAKRHHRPLVTWQGV